MIELKLPELGENIEAAEVSRILVAEGDTVKDGQSVLELESDKASFPLPSPQAGRVAKIHVKAGDNVSVGQTVLEIEEADAAQAQKESGNGKKHPEAKEAGATRQARTKAEDDKPKKTKKEEESSKPEKSKEEKPKEAVHTEHEPKKSKEEKPKEVVHAEDEDEEPENGAEEDADRADDAPGRADEKHSASAGPATRRLARELGVNLRDVPGSERGGRITRDDVKAFVKQRLLTAPARNGPPADEPPLPDFSRWGPVRRQALSKIDRASASQLSRAWRTIPHVTQHDQADITELDASRQRFNEAHRESGPKITMTALAIHAAVAALKAYPPFNSSFDPAAEELILKDYYHIGVAVDTENGLLVPVVRDADRKSLAEVAAELIDLAEKARQRSLTPKDMEGGTFTITNLGGIGGSFFSPIINFPEVAILGIGRADWQSRGEQPAQRLLAPLSLSYDHRVINGADAARFVRKVAELLADPFEMLAGS